MEEIAPNLAVVDEIEAPTLSRSLEDAATSSVLDASVLTRPFPKLHDNYFATDHISRSSKVLKRAAKDLPLSRSSWL